MATSYEYGLAVIVLAVFAGVNLIRLRTHDYADAGGPAGLAPALTHPCR